MRIAFFTEGRYEGKVPREHIDIRTDVAWVCSLGANHHPIPTIHDIPSDSYDIGVIIIPKNRRHLLEYPLVENMKRVCKKVAAMQEAVLWYWQDSPIDEQIWYFNVMTEMDFLFVHNEIDKKYFNGLTNKPCEILPSVLITDTLKLSEEKDRGAIIGGNCVSIYSGFDSLMIAQEYSDDVWAPTMGRKQENEEAVVNHLPYLKWNEWMYELSRFKVGVFPTANVAAGQFALNCSYLGIPCVGYDTLDSQRILHPHLTVPHYNLDEARKKVKELKNDKHFYEHCSKMTRYLYEQYYSEKVFVEKLTKILESRLNETN